MDKDLGRLMAGKALEQQMAQFEMPALERLIGSDANYHD